MNVSKLISLIVASIFLCGCFVKKSDTEFILSGTIKNKKLNKKDSIILSYVNVLQEQIVDTIITDKNNFKFKGNIRGATICYISLGKLSYDSDDKNSISFFLEPTKINLILNNDNISQTEISGSKTQTEFLQLEALTKPIYEDLTPFILRRNELARLKKSNDTSIINEIDRINEVQKIKLQQIKDIRLRFGESHHDSYLNPYWLNAYRRELPIDYIKLHYNKLSKDVKNSFYAIKILEYLKSSVSTGILKVGDKLPDFQLKNVKLEYESLNDLPHKNYLIVFWASWCGPCREEIPFLKDLYKKYLSSKFDIVSISLDQIEGDWKKALNNDKPDWIQFLDLKGFKSDLANQLDIKAIPHYILIDTEGRILDKDLSKANLQSRLDKLFLEP